MILLAINATAESGSTHTVTTALVAALMADCCQQWHPWWHHFHPQTHSSPHQVDPVCIPNWEGSPQHRQSQIASHSAWCTPFACLGFDVTLIHSTKDLPSNLPAYQRLLLLTLMNCVSGKGRSTNLPVSLGVWMRSRNEHCPQTRSSERSWIQTTPSSPSLLAPLEA